MDRVLRAAGILEGEGYFSWRKRTGAPKVSCHMTDLDVLEELHNLFGGNIVKTKKQQEHHKQAWRWTAEGETGAYVMRAILPHMFSRRSARIQECLAVWDQVCAEKRAERAAYVANAKDAAKFWLDNKDSYSLRSVARSYGISHQTVKNYATNYVMSAGTQRSL